MPPIETEEVFHVCRKLLAKADWRRLTESVTRSGYEGFVVAARDPDRHLPLFAGDLADLELARHRVATAMTPAPGDPATFAINPSLELRHLEWQCCTSLAESSATPAEPIRGEEWAMVWRDPATGEVRVRPASLVELLALKLVSEETDLETAAAQSGRTPAALHSLLLIASHSGIVLAPSPRIVRTDDQVPGAAALPPVLREAHIFTLQWHLTNRCDLNCKHCYDRTDRETLTTGQSVGLLDDFAAFCVRNRVRGMFRSRAEIPS